MKLKEFLIEEMMPVQVFAKNAEISRNTILRALDDLGIRYHSAKKISDATSGKVSIQELPISLTTTFRD